MTSTRAGAQRAPIGGGIETSSDLAHVLAGPLGSILPGGLTSGEALFEAAFHHAPNGLALISVSSDDADPIGVMVNQALLALLGTSAVALGDQSVLSLIAPEDHPTFERMVSDIWAGADHSAGDIRLRRPDGDHVWTRLTVKRFPTDGGTALMVTVADIRERKRLESELRQKALHDPLTGLANRRLLDERLDEARSRTSRDGCSMAVIYLDLDRFKSINDDAGHAVGDRALAAIAERLRGALRPTDTLARIGGDEFVIVCDGLTHPDHANEVAARAHAAVCEPLEVQGRRFELSASLGVVTLDGSTAKRWTSRQLLDAADQAMYRSKRGDTHHPSAYLSTERRQTRLH